MNVSLTLKHHLEDSTCNMAGNYLLKHIQICAEIIFFTFWNNLKYLLVIWLEKGTAIWLPNLLLNSAIQSIANYFADTNLSMSKKKKILRYCLKSTNIAAPVRATPMRERNWNCGFSYMYLTSSYSVCASNMQSLGENWLYVIIKELDFKRRTMSIIVYCIVCMETLKETLSYIACSY